MAETKKYSRTVGLSEARNSVYEECLYETFSNESRRWLTYRVMESGWPL
jgi:hypothetical protein